MPFALNLHGRIVRHTYWSNSTGDIVQVSCAVINESDWEPLSEVTKLVGPFDDAKAELQAAQQQALAAADRQFNGQLSL